MAQRPLKIPENRLVSVQELELLRFLLSKAELRGQSFVSQINDARVVSRCGCGCASVDFSVNGVVPQSAGLEPISHEYYWNTPSGGLCAVFVYAREDQLAGLEVYSVDGAETPTSLPALDQVRATS